MKAYEQHGKEASQEKTKTPFSPYASMMAKSSDFYHDRHQNGFLGWQTDQIVESHPPQHFYRAIMQHRIQNKHHHQALPKLFMIDNEY